jgi:hypothetical protein
MIFTLEVLQAKYGDCLLLHYGTVSNPVIFIIDGGPPGVYNAYLKPRLKEIKGTISTGNPLPLSLVMVSHLDDDHVNGILQLVSELVENEQNHRQPEFVIENLWFNSFDDIIGNIQIPVISSFTASASAASSALLPPLIRQADHSVQAVISSTGQGRKLRDNAETMSIAVNYQFNPLKPGVRTLVTSDLNDPIINWSDQLKITVLHPNRQRIIDLQKQWDKDLKKAKQSGDNSIIYASIASNDDTSVFNLSSIVCLVEFNNKTMLLTGDARSDDILEGLKQMNLLDSNGKIVVDVLKLPHHGSNRNITEEFFKAVNARNYIISADGKYGNPDKETLEMLAAGTAGRNDFTIHLTNHEGEGELKALLDNFFKKQKDSGRSFKMKYRKIKKNSILIELLGKIGY